MDLRLVRKLLSLMETHGLVEVEIEEEGSKVRLRKEGSEAKAHPQTMMAPIVQAHTTAAPSGANHAERALAGEHPPIEVADGLLVIKSPMVGTFYRSSSPEAEPFVSVGQEVDDETVVCIIEAMKVMNEIRAEVSGEIAAVLAENGEAIEFGQPLYKVKPAGSGKSS